MSNDDQRAAFEAWAAENGLTTIRSHGDLVYRSYKAHLAWLAWQAAIEHAMSSSIISSIPVKSMEQCTAAQIEGGGYGRQD